MRFLICVTVVIVSVASATQAALVAATSQRDTLSMPFRALDSLGNDANLTAGDSVYLTVFSPGGDIVYKDSMAYNASSIVTGSWEDYAGADHYALVKQIHTLNGGSSSRGVYSYVISVDDNTGADLTTSTSGFFQVLNSTLESSLDSAVATLAATASVMDSLEDCSDRLKQIVDSINVLLNSPAVAEITTDDKQQIAGYVDDTLSAKHGAGSWAASSVGTGAFSTTVVAFDSAQGLSISGAAISIYNLSQSSLKAVIGSDINGHGSVNLDADSHLVVATAPGFLFSPFDTLVIVGPQFDTVFGIHFHPGFPSLPELCRVWGFVYDVDGSPVVGGQVSASLPAGVARVQSTILTPTGVTATTDSIGYFYLDLFPSALLNPAGATYEFSIALENGSILRRRLTIPQEANWQLTW